VQTSPLVVIHAAAGARTRPGPRGPEVLTFGNVPSEYEAGLRSAALFDATTRGLVRASGPDAGAFLHRITAHAVRGMLPGQGGPNLLLNSKGKVLHAFDLGCSAAGFDLSVAPGREGALLAELDKYLFTEQVRLEDASAQHAPLELAGPQAREVARAVGATEMPESFGQHAIGRFAGCELRLTRCAVAGSEGLRLEVEPGHVVELWDALVAAGARPAGCVARDILRVEACQAEWGSDIDENIYPQEARLERSFSLDKGCYIGQEVVAKIDTYGGLNKRLVPLRLPHDDPIPRGTPLWRLDDGEWRELGLVTSWAYSFVLDTGIALGYVKRRHQAIGTRLRVGAGPAEAEIVAMPVRAGGLPVSGDFEAATAIPK
jgi:folate-binding protein YgfZ